MMKSVVMINPKKSITSFNAFVRAIIDGALLTQVDIVMLFRIYHDHTYRDRHLTYQIMAVVYQKLLRLFFLNLHFLESIDDGIKFVK